MSDEEKFEIVLLLGAGASKPAKVPTTKEFVDEFLAKLRHEKKRDELKAVKQIIEILNKNLKKKRERVEVDIEILLEVLEALETKEDNKLLYFYENLDENFLLKGLVEKTNLIKDLKDFIVEKTTVDKEEIHYLSPLKDFIKESRPLRILTVNYDTAIEQFCEEYKIPYTDGFDLYWNPSNFDDEDKYDVHLYKLHGSITWYQTNRKNYLKSLVKPEGNKISLITKEEARSLILYPAQKWFYSDPILELLLKARKILENNDVKVLIVIGFSFRDDHIREILWNAARKNRDLVIFLIAENPLEIYEKRLKYYEHGATKIESSLRGRVICLPYDIEKLLRELYIHYIQKYKNAYVTEKKKKMEIPLLLDKPFFEMIGYYLEVEHISKIEMFLKDYGADIKKRAFPLYLDCLLEIYLLYVKNPLPERKNELERAPSQEEKEITERKKRLDEFKESILELLAESVNFQISAGTNVSISLSLSANKIKELRHAGSEELNFSILRDHLSNTLSEMKHKKRYLFETFPHSGKYDSVLRLLKNIVDYLDSVGKGSLFFYDMKYYDRIKSFEDERNYEKVLNEIRRIFQKRGERDLTKYSDYFKEKEIEYIKREVLEM